MPNFVRQSGKHLDLQAVVVDEVRLDIGSQLIESQQLPDVPDRCAFHLLPNPIELIHLPLRQNLCPTRLLDGLLDDGREPASHVTRATVELGIFIDFEHLFVDLFEHGDNLVDANVVLLDGLDYVGGVASHFLGI